MWARQAMMSLLFCVKLFGLYLHIMKVNIIKIGAMQEKAIVAAVLDGDHEQYRLLVDRYHRGLIQHLYNFTHDGDIAEDLAQDAFIRAYEKLAQYDATYAFSTWLYKIADNLAKRYIVTNRHVADIDEIAEIVPDTKPSLPELAETSLTKQQISRAVDALPSEYRHVVVLYYWDGFSYDDIATVMERPIGTIRTWLYRAKEQLRKELYGKV